MAALTNGNAQMVFFAKSRSLCMVEERDRPIAAAQHYELAAVQLNLTGR